MSHLSASSGFDVQLVNGLAAAALILLALYLALQAISKGREERLGRIPTEGV